MTKPNGSSFPAMPPSAWQREIDAALKESDPKKVLERVHAAETEINHRLNVLAHEANQSETADVQRQATALALEMLRVLKRDKLGFPDWNGKA